MSSPHSVVAIVGRPNVGKSTTFNALTKAQNAESANYPFCTIEPNIGIVNVVDERIIKISEIIKKTNPHSIIMVGNSVASAIPEILLKHTEVDIGVFGEGDITDIEAEASINKLSIPALQRGIIDEVFPTGVKSIDSSLTTGKGQKVGIFAGSGVGKSTLMGMITKGCEAQIKVIALI